MLQIDFQNGPVLFNQSRRRNAFILKLIEMKYFRDDRRHIASRQWHNSDSEFNLKCRKIISDWYHFLSLTSLSAFFVPAGQKQRKTQRRVNISFILLLCFFSSSKCRQATLPLHCTASFLCEHEVEFMSFRHNDDAAQVCRECVCEFVRLSLVDRSSRKQKVEVCWTFALNVQWCSIHLAIRWIDDENEQNKNANQLTKCDSFQRIQQNQRRRLFSVSLLYHFCSLLLFFYFFISTKLSIVIFLLFVLHPFVQWLLNVCSLQETKPTAIAFNTRTRT